MLDLTRTEPVKIMIASPAGGENIKLSYMVSVIGLLGSISPQDATLAYLPIPGSNIAENQNTIVREARKAAADYVLLVETDMSVPKHALAQLLSHQKDIVGCTYPYKDADLLAKVIRGDKVTLRYMGHEIGASPITINGLIKGEPLRTVDFLPMGLMLISMRAFDAVVALRTADALERGAPAGKSASPFFHPDIYPDDSPHGLVSTTDSAFCRTAIEAGFDVWLDARLSLQIGHHGDCAYGLLPDEAPNPVKELQDKVANEL